MARFKDLSPEWISKLISPKYQQVSLSHMLANFEFTEVLAKQRKALAITTSGRQYLGTIQFVGDRYTLNFPEGTKVLRNDQHLVVTFSMKDKNYYFQARSVHVFNRKVDLGTIPARFYERKKVDSPVTLTWLSKKLISDCKDGGVIVRHFYPDNEETHEQNFMSRETLVIPTGKTVPLSFEPSEILMAMMRDISQGGCSLVLGPLPGRDMHMAQAVHLQMTIRMQRRSRAISCFAVIKETKKHGNHLLVRCEFFTPLPTLHDILEDGTKSYRLRFGEKAKAVINGESYKPTEDLELALPFGNHVAQVTWPDETQTVLIFSISDKTPTEIDLGRSKSNKKKMESIAA